MASESKPQIEYEKLGETKLTFLDVIAQSVGFMGPVFGAILLLVTVVGANFSGKGAGLATPVAIIIAAIGIAAVGWIIAQFAKRIHAAGALYDYISAGFGEKVGFVFGWIYLGGLLILAVAIPLLIGGQTSDFLKSAYNIGIPYWVCGLIYAAILFAVLYLGVKISTRIQLILVLFSASIVTIFLIYVIFKAPHLSAKPFNPGSAHGARLRSRRAIWMRPYPSSRDRVAQNVIKAAAGDEKFLDRLADDQFSPAR